MKYILSLLLAVAVGFGVLPVTTFAMESNEPEFKEFLKDIGWDKQDYIDYLESKDWYLEDFDFVDELGTPLTEVSIPPVLEEFELNREELNALLIENGDLEKGQDVLEGTSIIFEEELSEYVDFYLNGWEGTPIDDKNLQQLLEDYDFESRDALEQFLNENDDSIENYKYIEDLEMEVDFYVNGAEYFAEIFSEFGLTEEEFDKLFAHFETLDYEDPAFEEKLLELGDRMMAFDEFETADELSADQIAELLDIYNDMLDLYQIETKYYLVKDGERKELSMETMMTMETTNGNNLLIEIYNKQGVFLADMVLTEEMFGSYLIQEAGKDMVEAEKKLTAKSPVKTVKGGKLPKTASDYAENTLVGLALILAGVFLFRRISVKGN